MIIITDDHAPLSCTIFPTWIIRCVGGLENATSTFQTLSTWSTCGHMQRICNLPAVKHKLFEAFLYLYKIEKTAFVSEVFFQIVLRYNLSQISFYSLSLSLFTVLECWTCSNILASRKKKY